MAENISEAQSHIENLRKEINNLRSQVENIVKSADEKGHDLTADMAKKIARELENCRHKASERAARFRDFSRAEINEVGDHVRSNPLLSILIAFGAGWVISCLFKHLR